MFVRFTLERDLSSGKRSFQRQWYFYNNFMDPLQVWERWGFLFYTLRWLIYGRQMGLLWCIWGNSKSGMISWQLADKLTHDLVKYCQWRSYLLTLVRLLRLFIKLLFLETAFQIGSQAMLWNVFQMHKRVTFSNMDWNENRSDVLKPEVWVHENYEISSDQISK